MNYQQNGTTNPDRHDDHQQWLKRANESVAKAAPTANADPHRLAYHFMAPAYWINDPNGLIHYRGEYHLFYQHHPYSPDWGPMHWGHAVSRDLVHWQHQPIALAPNEPYDNGGCFSGSAIEQDGRMYLFYTGNIQSEETRQVQNVAVSDDGITFRKYEGNPIISESPTAGSGDFRDPKVWKRGDRWYMVVGTGRDGRGKIALYVSDDLIQWKFLNIMLESDGTQGWMWECPDLFPLGDKHVLIFSPIGMEGVRVVYFIGDMDYERGVFSPESFGAVDQGFDFYAPQTFEDDRGRRILIGWMNDWNTPVPTKANLWAGAMSLPRELTLRAGQLRMEPVSELAQLRKEEVKLDGIVIDPTNPLRLPELDGDALEISIRYRCQDSDALQFGLKLRQSSDGQEETVVRYDAASQTLTIDRTRSGIVEGLKECAVEPDEAGRVSFRLFLDRSSLELFANDGRSVLSTRIYPSPASSGIELYAEGGHAAIEQLHGWRLKSIW